jgi:4-amino-4-deoxy-L-arabinose transferase-like glycosyltransferase
MKRSHQYIPLLAIVLLVGLSVRLWGLSYDLPYIYHPDEPLSLSIIQPIFKTGDLNPHFFEYPSLFYYLNAAAYIPYYLVGKTLGVFAHRADILAPVSLTMGVTRAQMPSTIIMGRMITVIFGVGCIILVYFIGKQLLGKAIVGLFAALLSAITLPNVNLSRFISPDTFVVFFALAAFLASVLIYQQGKTRWYVIAGLCVGLTASTKYNGGLILLPMILAHFLRFGKAALKNLNLYLALVLCAVGFLAATPYAALDFHKFWADMTFQASHYSTGHPGMEGNSLEWYLDYMWYTGGIIYVLGFLGIIRGITSRNKEIILLSAFPVVYFIFIASLAVRNDRTLLPVTPFLFLLAANFFESLVTKISSLNPSIWRMVAIVGMTCLAITTVAWPASAMISDTLRLTTVDSRETSRVWIDANLPHGVKIAVESYAPFIDPTRFSVEGFVRITDHKPEWYLGNGFQYLVFSQGMYGRFFNDPARYSSDIAQYKEFFTRFVLVKIFNDGNYEIRLYQITPQPIAISFH